MLEFLMYRMKDFVSETSYRELVCQFTVASKSDNIQGWVETVRNVIGIDSYETIKNEYRRDLEEKNQSESRMHCTPKEKQRTEIIFQEDIGASLSICIDEYETEELFCDILYGINN